MPSKNNRKCVVLVAGLFAASISFVSSATTTTTTAAVKNLASVSSTTSSSSSVSSYNELQDDVPCRRSSHHRGWRRRRELFGILTTPHHHHHHQGKHCRSAESILLGDLLRGGSEEALEADQEKEEKPNDKTSTKETSAAEESEDEEDADADEEHDTESEETGDEYDEEEVYEEEEEEEEVVDDNKQKEVSRGANNGTVKVEEKSNFDEPLVASPMLQLYATFGVMMLSRKLDFFNPTVVRIARFAFIGYLVILQAFLFYVRVRAKAANDRTPVKLTNALTNLVQSQLQAGDMVKNLASSFLSSDSTVLEYDLKQAKSMQSGLLFNMCFMWFLHFKMEQLQPLMINTVTGMMNLVYSPLFQVYVLGRNLERPFKNPAMQKHEELAAADTSPSETETTIDEDDADPDNSAVAEDDEDADDGEEDSDDEEESSYSEGEEEE